MSGVIGLLTSGGVLLIISPTYTGINDPHPCTAAAGSKHVQSPLLGLLGR
jgi:hypothetical protein